MDSSDLDLILYIVPWAHPSQPLNGILIGSAVFAQYTYRHTDTQTTLRATSVAIGRIYAAHAMRPKIRDISVSIEHYHKKQSLFRVGAKKRSFGGSESKRLLY